MNDEEIGAYESDNLDEVSLGSTSDGGSIYEIDTDENFTSNVNENFMQIPQAVDESLDGIEVTELFVEYKRNIVSEALDKLIRKCFEEELLHSSYKCMICKHPTSIRYICVARLSDRKQLAFYFSADTSEFEFDFLRKKAQRCLESKSSSQHRKVTIADNDAGNIHLSTDHFFSYLVICREDYPQRVAFDLLGSIQKDCKAMSTDLIRAHEYSLSVPMQNFFQKYVDQYNHIHIPDHVRIAMNQIETSNKASHYGGQNK